MKSIFISVLCVFSISNSCLMADEGMWLLPLIESLNINSMDELGSELTAEEIYSINNSCIKDAIVIFGGGCTGEIVSKDGLLFTNHHCGYDEIQNHSTVENDILENGFWAMSHDEELVNPDLEVRFLVRIEEVTDSILKDLSSDLLESVRKEKISELIEEIILKASQDEKYEAEVKPFFAGTYFPKTNRD